MKIFSFNSNITNISPYSIILSCIALFISAYIITSKSTQFSLKTNLLISSTIFASPFLLQNLSFRYDCLAMGLAVLACTIPFIFVDNIKKFAVFSLICSLFTCFTYQPALIVYPLSAFIICASIAKDNIKLAIKTSIISFVCILIPIVIYISLIMFIGEIPWYLRIIGARKLLDLYNVYERFFKILTFTITSLNIVQKIALSIIFILSLIMAALNLIKSKLINRIFIISLILLAFPLSISIVLFSSNMPILSRFFLGFPFLFIFFICIFDIKYEKIAVIASLLLTIIGFSSVSTYSSALTEQYNFEKNQILMAFSNINTKDKTIFIFGNLPYTNSVKLKNDNFPIISKIVPIYTSRILLDTTAAFLQNLGIVNHPTQYEIRPMYYESESYNNMYNYECNMKITKQSLYFNLYESDEIIVLDFEKKPCHTKK